ncbi:hypothetical protein [Chlamydia felis Fe/C-56]|uniref:Uncharacterized protein n=1 Tax=Chlamydia felis (strain Fe/C-56) TaxID=264202 RepID=Q255J7_CHLFF|nr:hypothetical protein [Chlamydia felis Fe/C-56]
MVRCVCKRFVYSNLSFKNVVWLCKTVLNNKFLILVYKKRMFSLKIEGFFLLYLTRK